MALWRRKTTKSPIKVPTSLKIIVASQCTLLAFSLLSCAGAVCFIVLGPRDILSIVSEALMLAASSLSIFYLLLHQFACLRESKKSHYVHRSQRNMVLSACMVVIRLIIITWIAASVLGLLVAANSPLCEDNDATRLLWTSLTMCKIQKAGVAVALASIVVSFVLFCALKVSNQPLAASLTGINFKSVEDEVKSQLSRQMSWTPSLAPSEKSFDLPLFDPVFDSLASDLYPPRARKSWLPPLSFQMPSRPVHNALMARPNLSRSQTNLLPPSINQLPRTPRESASTTSHSPFTRSPAARSFSAPSSVYSQYTSASTASRHPSTISSFSSISSTSSPLSTVSLANKPEVPTIPEQYRRPIHSLRSGGRPLRPGSRPGMPPAEFWIYARARQQEYNKLLNTNHPAVRSPDPLRSNPQSVDPEDPFQGHSLDSAPNRKPSLYRFPSSSEKAALRPNIMKHNTMRVNKKRTASYEGLRKGRTTSLSAYPWLPESVSDNSLGSSQDGQERSQQTGQVVKRRQSRTLVKKRQPWDAAPRKNTERKHF